MCLYILLVHFFFIDVSKYSSSGYRYISWFFLWFLLMMISFTYKFKLDNLDFFYYKFNQVILNVLAFCIPDYAENCMKTNAYVNRNFLCFEMTWITVECVNIGNVTGRLSETFCCMKSRIKHIHQIFTYLLTTMMSFFWK